jgi:HAD superfamily phosphatase (TIGR01668 family)
MNSNKDKERFEALRKAYPGRKLLIVSNTAGALSYDKDSRLAAQVQEATGVTVLSHGVKKPGCGSEIMSFFKDHPETGVTGPHHVAVVGDRLTTDMMLANMNGSWGLWVRDGVVPLAQKSLVSATSTSAICRLHVDQQTRKLSLLGASAALLLFSRPEDVHRQSRRAHSSDEHPFRR